MIEGYNDKHDENKKIDDFKDILRYSSKNNDKLSIKVEIMACQQNITKTKLV